MSTTATYPHITKPFDPTGGTRVCTESHGMISVWTRNIRSSIAEAKHPSVAAALCLTLAVVTCSAMAQEKIVLSDVQQNWSQYHCWEDPMSKAAACTVQALDDEGHPLPHERIYALLLDGGAGAMCCTDLLFYSNLQWDAFGNAYLVMDNYGGATLELDKLDWTIDTAAAKDKWLSLQFIWPKEKPKAAWTDASVLNAARLSALDTAMLKIHVKDCPQKQAAKPKKGTRN